MSGPQGFDPVREDAEGQRERIHGRGRREGGSEGGSQPAGRVTDEIGWNDVLSSLSVDGLDLPPGVPGMPPRRFGTSQCGLDIMGQRRPRCPLSMGLGVGPAGTNKTNRQVQEHTWPNLRRLWPKW